MLKHLKSEIRRFTRDESGLVTAEAVIAMPFLVWWYVGSFVFFDAFQARNINLKAAYTVSDMLSREDGSIDKAYIEGLAGVYGYLVTGSGTNPNLRVTVLQCTENCDGPDTGRTLEKDWSYSTGGEGALTNADLSGYLTRIPTMPAGDRVVMVESFIDYEPIWQVGIVDPTDFDNLIVTRLRFIPQLPCTDCEPDA